MRRILAALSACLLLAAPAVADDDKPDVESLARRHNVFALKLYGRVCERDGNVFLAPYSLSTALALTSAGARGATLDEMEKALELPEQERLHPAAAALLKQLNAPRKEKNALQLAVANSLWGQKDYGFLPDFLKTAKDHYGGGLREVDFKTDADKARDAINDWAARETHDRIKDLLPQNLLSTDTRLVLANAVYFKAGWEITFDKAGTKTEKWRLNGGDRVEAPMMHLTAKFNYYHNDSFQILELPYKGKEASMVVVLPKKLDGLGDVEQWLTEERLSVTMVRLAEREMEVTLPKFKVTSAFKLKRVLGEMGMPTAFTSKADFSGLAGGKEPLYIADVVHKAYVDVHEEGTEAAGASAVVVETKEDKGDPAAFRADRPFFFVIRDNKSGVFLFLGRVMDPTKN
jgi:serpin B